MMDSVRIGEVQERRSVTGRLTGYQLELWHSGLHEHALVKAEHQGILQNKVAAKLASWEKKWSRVKTKHEADKSIHRSKEKAEALSAEAQAYHYSLRSILQDTLKINDAVEWAALEDHRPFVFEHTAQFPDVIFDDTGVPQQAKPVSKPKRPERQEAWPAPAVGLLDRIFPPRRRAKEAEHQRRLEDSEARYQRAIAQWGVETSKAEKESTRRTKQLEEARAAYAATRTEFVTRQAGANERVQDLHRRYRDGDAEAVIQNCELILNASEYPDCFSTDFVINLNPETRVLVIDYQLPAKGALPTLSKVSFVPSRGEFKEAHLPEAELNRLYDQVLYQVALRTVHELFEGDTAKALDSICFNGWVEDVNPATGKLESGCLLSVQARKEVFEAIDLGRVDPKACFKQLKGVAAAKLSGMTPIRPILQLETHDRRFIASYEVADSLHEGSNLAAMDWEDFEHLIRELFAKEFSGEGAEVKVTRASADGGVDAVVFDPDPIRGGKIVIQAKRYTNTVGVSAVRDLYGTVLNEGANKGILVTTAEYGPDAYEFATGKPLTLLNGSNLLHLLEKHGHKARIDLREAKQLAVEQKRQL